MVQRTRLVNVPCKVILNDTVFTRGKVRAGEGSEPRHVYSPACEVRRASIDTRASDDPELLIAITIVVPAPCMRGAPLGDIHCTDVVFMSPSSLLVAVQENS